MSATKPESTPKLTEAERKLVAQLQSAACKPPAKPASLIRQLVSTPLLIY